MTDHHPLTDEMIRETFDPKFFTFSGENTSSWYNEEDMRAAADWQLKQVIEWLRNNLDESYIWAYVSPPGIDAESVITDLKQAMRPTQEDN